MNEIKFKGKMKDEFSLPKAGFDFFTLKELMSGQYNFSEYESWCRYTGLKDKNNKEIYENDIVKLKDSPDVWQVLYDDFGVPLFEANAFSSKKYRLISFEMFFGEYSKDGIEIIGNAKENFELLQK